MSEAQCYAVCIWFQVVALPFGGRTSEINCTGRAVGPTDFLEMKTTNSHWQPENKFLVHSLKFQFQTVNVTTASLKHVVGTAFTFPVERSPSSVLSAITSQLFIQDKNYETS
jgi:hypothetical protein